MSLDLRDATILVLAPHTDDGELGAGGSISRFAREGNVVHYVAFSACETVQEPDGNPEVLRDECSVATRLLGVTEPQLQILHFEVRNFARDRQGILDVMVQLNAELRPDLVLAPSTDDVHQDHQVVAAEATRAFKRTRLLGYEVPWNNYHFDLTAFVALKEGDVDRKCEALAAYASQGERNYMSREYVESLARVRGVQAGTRFAEGFQVVRWYF